jgi:hypothetical protein
MLHTPCQHHPGDIPATCGLFPKVGIFIEVTV